MTSLFIQYLGNKLAGWRTVLQQPVSWPVLAVAAYVFLAPNIDFAAKLAWHDGQRIAQLVVISLLVLVLTASRAKIAFADAWADLPRWSRWALAAVFALGMVSAVQAPLPRWGLLEWGMSVLLLTTALAVAAARRELGKQMDMMLVLLFFSTALAYTVTTCGVYVLMLLVGPAYGLGFDMRELYTGFSNIRFFGYVQTMLLPFLLLPALYWGTTRGRLVLLWSVPAIWWMLAIGSGTRGTWVALTAGIIAALWFGGSCGRKWAVWQLGGFLTGLLCYLLFVLAVPQLFDLPVSFLHRTGDIVSLSLREVIWSLAWQFVLDHPWLGVGPMHFAYWAKVVAAHPHNAVLQWLAEWGTPAALLLIGLWAAGGMALAAYVRRTAAQGDDRAQFFRVALLAALTGASAQAMVDGVLVMPVSQMLLVLLAGWAMGMMWHLKPIHILGTTERVLLALTVFFAATVSVWGVVPEIGDLLVRYNAFIEVRYENEILRPRFWTQGWIRP